MAGLAVCLLVPGLSHASAEAAKTLSAQAFSAELVGFQQMAERCSVDARACESAQIPERQQVEGSVAGTFQLSWGWLRDALDSAKKASAPDRARAMRAVQEHLSALGTQAGAATEPARAEAFRKARAAANAALSGEEFRTATEGPSWWDRLVAKIQDAVLSLFSGVGRLGARAPWLAPLIEWGCFALAAAGLLWFVRQSLARQALRISLSEGALLAGAGERDSADWARLAQERAAAADWREAIHCLYWAGIALMESRRAWKPNATRTPREYLRLLRPGSEAQRSLQELTRHFERVWYGHGEAGEVQYRSARESYRALEAAKPERTSDPAQGVEVRSTLATMEGS